MRFNGVHVALKIAMLENGITQAMLAKRWHCSETYVSRRMTGKEHLTTWEVLDLMALLKIATMHEFLKCFFPSLLPLYEKERHQ